MDSKIGRRQVIRAVAAAAVGASMIGSVAAAPVKMRIAVVPGAYAFLPIFLAVERGFFAAEGLDLEVMRSSQPQQTLMPMLARGDIDLLPTPFSAAILNASKSGFDIKVGGAIAQEREGWNSGTWLVVRNELYESGRIKTISDMKGAKLEAGPAGSQINLAANMALQKAGLSRTDVHYSTRLTLPEWMPAMINGTVDVLATFEPVATQMEKRGLARKLVGFRELAGDLQTLFFVASETHAAKNKESFVKFFRAYIRAAKLLSDVGGRWTPELLQLTSKWTNVEAAILQDVPGPLYYGQLGRIDPASVQHYATFWKDQGLGSEYKASDLMNSSFIDEAIRQSR